MAKLKLMKKEWFNWFKETTLENITAWTEYYYINPDSQHWISNYQLWNEEWEEGHWDASTGLPATRQGKIRNKTPIPCLPNTTYHQINNSGGLNLYFYDKNGYYLGAATFLESIGNDNDFTTPSDAYFINFSTFGSSTSTYNHDICISVSNPTFNGHYEPYIIKIEDILGVVDLGELNWYYDATYQRFSTDTWDLIKGIKDTSSSGKLLNAFCSKYTQDIAITSQSSGATKPDKTFWFYLSSSYSSIQVKDTKYTDATAFKEDMSNVYIVYIKSDSPIG